MTPARLLHAAIALFLLTALALSGCAAPKPPPGATTASVDMKGTKFVPMDVKIQVGGTVAWTNSDPLAHDVTEKDKAWQSDGGEGGMNATATWSRTFDAAGTFEYYCTVHSAGAGNGMWGKVVVVA